MYIEIELKVGLTLLRPQELHRFRDVSQGQVPVYAVPVVVRRLPTGSVLFKNGTYRDMQRKGTALPKSPYEKALRGNINVALELDVNTLRRVVLLCLEVRDFPDEIREEAEVDLGLGPDLSRHRQGHGDDEGAAEERGLSAHV